MIDVFPRRVNKFFVVFFIFNNWVSGNSDTGLLKNMNNVSVYVELPGNNLTYYNAENNGNVELNSPIATEETEYINFNASFQIIQGAIKNISNPDCVKDFKYVLEAIGRKERWALEMIDSFSKHPENILYGNYYQLGNFDECIKINDYDASIVKVQYCLIDIYLKKNFVDPSKHTRTEDMAMGRNRSIFDKNFLHWSICLPSSCSTHDADIFVRSIFSSFSPKYDVFIDDNLPTCETDKILPITTGEIIYGTIVGAFLTFTVMATFFDCWCLYYHRKNVDANSNSQLQKQFNTVKETLVCFSLINTTRRFFHTKPNQLNLESICGIKFISMFIILVGHSLIFIFGGPIINTSFFLETATKTEHAIFINSPIIVDTFLLISAFLMCRLLLLELDKRKGKINFLMLYIARYIRLTPAYAVILGLYVTYLPRIGSGPLWNSRVSLEKERCENSWWLNLLYINNYVGTDNLCMFQSWYLAVDYHLFILAPFVIYPLWKKPKLGEAILFFCFLASIFVPFTITYIEGLDPTMMGYPPEVNDLGRNFYFVNYYIKTHMRCSSYCIGLFYAYMVHKIQSNSEKIPTYANVLGWIFAITCGAASILGVGVFYESDHVPNIIENAFYSALHRVGWSISVGWTLLACVTNNAGLVNKFLSHKFFIPASRLTYCAYLANGLVEVYSAGIMRQPVYLGIFELVCKTSGHVITTFAMAFLLCIVFESPIHGMEKILLRNDTKKNQKSHQNGNLSA
ncbi:nose resistant to fluoxetine protein 6-like [Diorhabda carinulata]|uniref:nose resistant to fluoxetine protein 6-like n=1 Tax=Diorhabda carinulata TaxID=1163345 RepID=UPI0025A2840B|nr:nose resistant to fluoxetine protein 6-like [Diorhabda carinulata]